MQVSEINEQHITYTLLHDSTAQNSIQKAHFDLKFIFSFTGKMSVGKHIKQPDSTFFLRRFRYLNNIR